MGPLIILSGPSGSGKTTVINRLLAETKLPLRLSVSATTRTRRENEQDGIDYHFWTCERFEQEIAAGAFLEHAIVFGNYYGTLRSEVEPYRQQGIGVILDIDVQGAEVLHKQCPDSVLVFLRTLSLEILEQRLRGRGTETDEAIERRLAGARRELARAGAYDYQVINDDLDTAFAQLRHIIFCQLKRGNHAR